MLIYSRKIPLFQLYQFDPRKGIILFIFTFISIQLLASYPQYYSRFYPGYIILKNKDSLAGQILISPRSYRKKGYDIFDDSVVIRTFDSTTSSILEFGVSRMSIAFLRLNYHILYFGEVGYSENYSPPSYWPKNKPDSIVEKSTEFANITYKGHEYLLRLVGSGKLKIYDFFENPEKRITEGFATYYFLTPIYTSLFGRCKVIMIDKGVPEEIPTRVEFRFNFQRSKFLVRFINRRYHMSFRLRNFTSNMEMIDYIASNG